MAARVPFAELPIGARFVQGGEVCVKLERELRRGMLHCSNASTAGGEYILCDEDQPVEPLPPGP